MSRYSRIQIFLILGCLFGASKSFSETYRAFSLRCAQQKLTDCHNRGGCSRDLTAVGGLRCVEGFIIDAEGSDVILFGKISSESASSLYLDDFIVALRCAYRVYAKDEYFLPPTCSIDPSEATIQKLISISKKLSSSNISADPFALKNEWYLACAEPHKVTVEGVPFNSRFAQIMVKADYDMKKIVDGTDQLGIDDFLGMADYMASDIEREFKKAGKRRKPFSLINRFWFCPAEYFFSDNGRLVQLIKCELQLLTEQKYINFSGKKFRGKVEPACYYAERVAQEFTDRYDEIASLRPIFSQLRDLYRWYVLAEAMKFKNAFYTVGLPIDFFLNEYTLWAVKVDESLPGHSRFKVSKFEKEVPDGTQTLFVAAPTCGGVYLRVEIGNSNFSAPKSSFSDKLQKQIISQRPTKTSLFWDVILEN